MRASGLVTEVKRIIYNADYSSDVDYSDAAILAIINRGRVEIAGGAERQNGVDKLAPLPELLTTATVTAEAAENTVAMPSSYQRGLHRVELGNEKLKKYHSLNDLLDRYSGETGQPEGYILKGRTLWFAPSPTADTTLKLYFHELPTDLAIVAYDAGPPEVEAVDSEPTELPDHLQARLLVNFTCKEIFAEIEGGMATKNSDYLKHDALYQRALNDLSREIGPEEAEAININDDFITDENII